MSKLIMEKHYHDRGQSDYLGVFYNNWKINRIFIYKKVEWMRLGRDLSFACPWPNNTFPIKGIMKKVAFYSFFFCFFLNVSKLFSIEETQVDNYKHMHRHMEIYCFLNVLSVWILGDSYTPIYFPSNTTSHDAMLWSIHNRFSTSSIKHYTK
jgi:hypothetical protein